MNGPLTDNQAPDDAPAGAPVSRHVLRDAPALVAISVVALFLRTWFQRSAVLGGSTVRFYEHDALYHMRLVDVLVEHFPRFLRFDPYAVWGGVRVHTAPLFDLLVAGLALLLAGGAPTPHQVDLAGAWVPPLLGAVLIIPVYALGRVLWNWRAGLLGAAVYAVMPGNALTRSSLGFADHHVLEMLFATLTLLAVSLAMRAPSAGTISWDFLLRHPRPTAPFLASAIAGGLALAGYFLSWTSATFLLAILVVWVGLETLSRTRSGEPLAPVLVLIAVVSGIALVVVAPIAGDIGGVETGAWSLALVSGCGALAGALAPTLERVRRRWRTGAILAGAALVFLLLILVFPGFLTDAHAQVRRLLPSEQARTVRELRSVFHQWGPFSLRAGWSEFASGWLVAIIGGVVVANLWRRTRRAELLLLLLFAATTLVLTLIQMRFAYYLAIAVALLGGIACDRLLTSRLPRLVAPLGIAILVFLPTTVEALRTARFIPGPEPWWDDAVTWLRQQTPDPFGSEAAYTTSFSPPAAGTPFAYPPSAYAVLSWWDHGYRIVRGARRIPSSNPAHHGVENVASFLIATRPDEAAAILDRGSVRYVIVDSSLAVDVWAWNLATATIWAGRTASNYFELYRVPDEESGFSEVMLFYPAYYQTMAVRLWTFGGAGYDPRDSTWLVESVERTGGGQGRYREITWMQRYATYDEAVQALRQHPNARIAGVSMAESPVPLARLPGFREVFRSEQRAGIPGTDLGAPRLRIFEYSGRSLD